MHRCSLSPSVEGLAPGAPQLREPYRGWNHYAAQHWRRTVDRGALQGGWLGYNRQRGASWRSWPLSLADRLEDNFPPVMVTLSGGHVPRCDKDQIRGSEEQRLHISIAPTLHIYTAKHRYK